MGYVNNQNNEWRGLLVSCKHLTEIRPLLWLWEIITLLVHTAIVRTLSIIATRDRNNKTLVFFHASFVVLYIYILAHTHIYTLTPFCLPRTAGSGSTSYLRSQRALVTVQHTHTTCWRWLYLTAQRRRREPDWGCDSRILWQHWLHGNGCGSQPSTGCWASSAYNSLWAGGGRQTDFPFLLVSDCAKRNKVTRKDASQF